MKSGDSRVDLWVVAGSWTLSVATVTKRKIDLDRDSTVEAHGAGEEAREEKRCRN
jgi:hypothetical protein